MQSRSSLLRALKNILTLFDVYSENYTMNNNAILNLSFQFSLEVVSYCEILNEERKYVISNQLLKSGTSIGANVREAQSPHSKADFIAKLIIALKEAEETEYWLLLCKNSPKYPDPTSLLDQLTPIKKILGRIISNSRKKGSWKSGLHQNISTSAHLYICTLAH